MYGILSRYAGLRLNTDWWRYTELVIDYDRA